MNKLKIAVSSILCFGLLASGSLFTACADGNTHNHSYATELTYDETYHWYAASCEHSDEVSGKAEHSYGDWTVTKQATCTEKGLREKTCVCGKKQTEEIAAIGHSYSTEWKNDETYHWYAASCEHSDEVSGKAEHSYGDWTVTKQATCMEKGSREKTCVCGKKQTEEIAAIGHSYSTEWKNDETYHWHAATCEHSDEVSNKAEHTYSNGTCSVCNKVEPITLTADTDFTTLVSDIVTEDEWKAAFDMNSVANFTEKLINNNGVNLNKTVTDTENGYRVVDCSSFTRSVYRKSSDGVISYSSDLKEWTTINFDDYGENKEKIESSVNWTMSFKALCPDFSNFFAKFKYNTQSGAYEFVGRDVCNNTDESSEFYNADCTGGSECTHSNMIKTNSIMENWDTSYYKVIVKIVDGKLAYVKVYMTRNPSSEIMFYNYGTTEITIPVSQTE